MVSGWTRACMLNELQESSPRGLNLNGEDLILVRWKGHYYAYLNCCPHAGWPLNLEPDKFLDSEKRFLQCSNHMALFEVTSGLCIDGPCRGQCLTPAATRVEDGYLYISW